MFFKLLTIISVSEVKILQSRTSDSKEHGQATKSARGMPWHWEPKKDGANTDMLRGAVSTH